MAKSEESEGEIKGSIAIPSEHTYLAGMAKVSLVQAVEAAVKKNSGKAISAELEEEDGYLVYSVEIVTGDGTVEVKVDAGNKQILKSEIKDEDEEEGEGHEWGEKGECHKRGEKGGEDD